MSLVRMKLCSIFTIAALSVVFIGSYKDKSNLMTIVQRKITTTTSSYQQSPNEESDELNDYSNPNSASLSTSTSGLAVENVNERLLDKKFDDMCGFWKTKVEEWQEKVFMNNNNAGNNKDNVLKAIQRRSGAGDRLSGTVTALMHAMQKGQKLQVNWKNIDSVFTNSRKLLQLSSLKSSNNASMDLVFKDRGLIEVSGKPGVMPYHACYNKAYYECSPLVHTQDHCPIYNRACMNDNFCKAMSEFYASQESQQEELTMAHVLGCPLRLLVSPTVELLDHSVLWFENGKEVNGSLDDLERALSKYRIISIHMRLGDYAFRGSSEHRLRPIEKDIKDCVQHIEEHVELSPASEDARDKPLRWFVASDDPNLKDFFRETYPNKTITFLHKPHHLDYIKRIKTSDAEREELKNMFAEWYILGRGEELLTNNAHPGFGISSFSRSAWLYNLKSKFFILRDYDGKSTCVRREFMYKGNINRVSKYCHPDDAK